MFKYERDNYICSEACSEKIAYELAKILGYECARIELAEDSENRIGVLNYFFSDDVYSPHTDIVSYLNRNNNERKYYYTISNIKKNLDEIDDGLFEGFIKIMIFDALIGEQDRHEENWGITQKDGKYLISPLYDNGDSILREFKNETTANAYYNGIKDFDSYIKRSKCVVYKENNCTKYTHFELIDYLNVNYNQIVKREIKNLSKLTDEKIQNIVKKIPNKLITIQHKKYIILYLKKRRDILLSINKRGD